MILFRSSGCPGRQGSDPPNRQTHRTGTFTASDTFDVGVDIGSPAAWFLASGPSVLAADKGFETPPTLKAADVLPAMLEGRRFRVEEQVHRFAARTDLKGKPRIILLRGQATPRAKQELTRLGWTVQEMALKKF